MNFAESVDYLYSLGNEVSAMKLGLENIQRLLDSLNDPQNKYLKVQVAGTNGKGSVCAFLDAICRSASIRTGLYTSPHLVSVTERIRINGSDITETDFARFATRVRDACEDLVETGDLPTVPTYFEQVTATALTAFGDAGVELAILETGLGGRFDATTAANAEIAAITRIDRDHQEYLGETIEKIAAEKAAIIRTDSKAVIVGDQQAEAYKVILNRIQESGLDPVMAERVNVVEPGGRIKFATDGTEYELSGLGLLGSHQIENAKIAILLAEELQKYFPISRDNIIAGLENARHPGRLEYDGKFLFDGAHNPGGARALRDYLDEFERRPLTLIFGAMRDKEVASMAKIIFPVSRKLILTSAENVRAMTPNEIAQVACPGYTSDDVHVAASAKDAVSLARTITPDDGLIVVTGSLYLVGEIKRIIHAT